MCFLFKNYIYNLNVFNSVISYKYNTYTNIDSETINLEINNIQYQFIVSGLVLGYSTDKLNFDILEPHTNIPNTNIHYAVFISSDYFFYKVVTFNLFLN
jgi:hypothetical protein